MPHDHWPGPPHPHPPGLEKHLRWLVSIGATRALDCTCPHAYKNGTLHGVSMGMEWVRLTTAPDCPDHGAPQ